MIKAVLVDMDGTLVDTEDADNAVAMEICKKLGFDLTDKEQQERHGRNTKSFYEWLRQKRGSNFDLQKTIQQQLADFERKLRENLKSFPGAKGLPKKLTSAGYRLAVVSGSTWRQIEIVLQALGIADFFDVIISADDIVESKPSPEGYLLAAKKLGVLPKECIILEDGPKGVAAGKSAKIKVIGIINNGGQDLSEADLIVKNLGEITIEMLQNFAV